MMKSFTEMLAEGWKRCPRCDANTRHEHESLDDSGNKVDRYRCQMCHQARDAKRKKKSAKKTAHLASVQATMDKLLKDDE